MTPTAQPLAELAIHLAVLSGAERAAVRRELAEHPGLAHLAVRQAVVADAARHANGHLGSNGDAGRLVLIVDQFEQIFTLDSTRSVEPEQDAFVTALCAAAANPAGPRGVPPALVIIAVRGDFWDRCAAHPELTQVLQEGQFVVGPMTESDLRRTVTGPADAAGLQIDASLVDSILSDLHSVGADTAGVLPLLSQAMLRTWENREGSRLTSHGYGAAGGVSKAVSVSADAVYGALPARQQALARDILQRMTVASRDGRLSRRPVTRTDLYGSRPAAERAQIDAVLEAFASERLLVLDDGIAEISHDVLLHAWPLLASWLADDQASLILYSQFSEDAGAWRDGREDPSFLYRGTQLDAILQATTRWEADPERYPSLDGPERDFLTASRHAARRSSRQRRVLAVTLVLLLVAALTGAGVAFTAARNADRQRSLAVSGELAAESEALDAGSPVTASLLAAAAWRVDPSPQAREAMLDVLAQPGRAVLTADTDSVTAVAFSPDGETLATASYDGTVRLWDVTTHSQIGAPMTARGGYMTAVAFSPDGKILATADSAGTAQLWDAATHRQIGAPMTADTESMTAVAFSPDGKTLATASDDGTARLWDVTTHRQIGAPITDGTNVNGVTSDMNAVAFSPDGNTLATGSEDGSARLWDVATHRQIGAPTVGSDVFGVAFSPDGKILATAGGWAQLWDVATHRQIGATIAGGTGVNGVAFSPDGTMLATASSDGTARLWDVATGQQIGAPMPAGTYVDGVAFSPDGTMLATANNDGSAQLWDVAVDRQIGAPITADTGIVKGVAFSPDGTMLATASWDDTARLWDVATGQQVGTPMIAHTSIVNGIDIRIVNAVAFSPDGKILAIASDDGTAQLWDVATHRQIGAPIAVGDLVNAVAFSPDGKILATASTSSVQLWDVPTHRQIGAPIASEESVDAVAFSPDGTTLATASGYTARLWDVATHREIGVPLAGDTGTVNGVAFSPDSTILATASSDGTARLWNVATDRQVGLPMGVTGQLEGVAFSPDGTILATAGGDGTARLWDVATYHEIGAPLTAVTGTVNGVAFSSDGKILATANSDGTARLWDVAFPKDVARAVCAIAGRSLTHQEWNAYIPSESFQQTCP